MKKITLSIDEEVLQAGRKYARAHARRILKRLVESHQPVISTDLEVIEKAIDINVISQLSYWDSLIVAAAEK